LSGGYSLLRNLPNSLRHVLLNFSDKNSGCNKKNIIIPQYKNKRMPHKIHNIFIASAMYVNYPLTTSFLKLKKSSNIYITDDDNHDISQMIRIKCPSMAYLLKIKYSSKIHFTQNCDYNIEDLISQLK